MPQGPISEAFVRITPDFSQFDDALQSSIARALADVADTVERAFESIEGTAANAAEAVGSSFDQSSEDIGKSLDTIDTSGLENVGTAADSAFTEVDQAAEDSATAVGSSFDGAASGIGGALDQAAVTGNDALDQIDGSTPAADLEKNFAEAGDSLGSSIEHGAEEGKAAIDSLADEAPTIDVEVDADTTAAQASLDDLAASSGEAGSGIESLHQGVEGLDAANGVLAGSLAGVSGILSKVSPEAALAAGGVAAVAEAGKEFFTEGLNAQSAAFRLDQTFGTLATTVQHVHVGDLTGEVGELGLKLGSTEPQIENAESRIGQLGLSSGAAAPEVAKTTQEIIALALRAHALNPELSDVGTSAGAMLNAFARGGRALAPYNIALSSAQINTEALGETGKTTAGDLTIYEKATAGATLATQQLGSHLKEDIEEGAKNPTIQLQALKAEFETVIEDLGKPVVSPTLDLLHNLEEIAVPVATGLGSVVQAVVPVADVLTSVLVPPLKIVGDILDHIPTEAIEVGGGLALISAGLFGLAGALAAVDTASPVLTALELAVGTAAVGVGAYRSLTGQAGRDAFNAQVKDETAALTNQDGQLRITAKSLADYITAKEGAFAKGNFADNIRGLGLDVDYVSKSLLQGKSATDVFGQSNKVLNAIFGSGNDIFAKAGGLLDHHNKQLNDAKREYDDLAKSTQTSAERQLAAGVATKDLDGKYLALGKSTGDYVTALNQAEDAENKHAQRLLDTEVAQGKLTIAQRDALLQQDQNANGTANYTQALADSKAEIEQTAQSQKDFATNIGAVAAQFPSVVGAYEQATSGSKDWGLSLADLALQLQSSGAGAEEFNTIAGGLGVTSEQLSGFVKQVNTDLESFVSDATGKLPTIGQAFDAAAQHAESEKRALSGQDILDALNGTLKSIGDYSKNLQTILGSSYHDLAGFAAQQGPAAVAAIAQSVTDRDGKVLDALRGNFETAIPNAENLATSLVQQSGLQFITANGTLAADANAAFGANFNIDQAIGLTLGQGQNALSAGLAPMPGVAAAGGAGTAAGFVQGLGPLVPGTSTQFAQVNALLQGSPLPATAGGLGAQVLASFNAGLAPLPLTTANILDTAGSAVRGSGVPAAAGTVGGQSAAQYQAGLNPVVDHTRNAFAGATAAVAQGGVPLKATATQVGDESGTGLGRQFGSSVTVAIGKGMQDAAAHSAINSAASNVVNYVGNRLEDGASGAGVPAGEDITRGVARGMQDGASHGAINSAAANLVSYAESRIRAHAQSSSPARRFMPVGRDMGLGAALGFAGPEVITALDQASATVVGRLAQATSRGLQLAQAIQVPHTLVSPSPGAGAAVQGGVQIIVGPNAVQVSFTGAVSDADALRVGTQVGHGLAVALAERQQLVSTRATGSVG